VVFGGVHFVFFSIMTMASGSLEGVYDLAEMAIARNIKLTLVSLSRQ
jgi:hypothetical protein